MGQGSLEPAVAKCAFCSVLERWVCSCRNCEKEELHFISHSSLEKRQHW